MVHIRFTFPKLGVTPIAIANMLINNALGNRVISFFDGNVGCNHIFMVEKDTSKTTFICLVFIGLFE
jgi:hypothetical protein